MTVEKQSALDALMADAPKKDIFFFPDGKTTIKLLLSSGKTELNGCWEKYESYFKGAPNGFKYTVAGVVIQSSGPGVADKSRVRYIGFNRDVLVKIVKLEENGWDDLVKDKGSCLVVTKSKKSNGITEYDVQPIKTVFDSKGVEWPEQGHAEATAAFATKMMEKQTKEDGLPF